MALSKQNKINLMNYCYNNHFISEYIRFDDKDLLHFKETNSFFLETENVAFEFKFYHFHKWMKRLRLSISKEEMKEYLVSLEG